MLCQQAVFYKLSKKYGLFECVLTSSRKAACSAGDQLGGQDVWLWLQWEHHNVFHRQADGLPVLSQLFRPARPPANWLVFWLSVIKTVLVMLPVGGIHILFLSHRGQPAISVCALQWIKDHQCCMGSTGRVCDCWPWKWRN